MNATQRQRLDSISANGTTFLVFTRHVGGMLEFGQRGITQEEFDELKRTRRLDITPSDRDGPQRDIVQPVFVMLLEVKDNYDFVLGTRREDARDRSA